MQQPHFEILADDIARAKKFYAMFGWEIQDIPEMDYVSLRTVPVDEKYMPAEPGAINGGMMKRTKEAPAPVIAIEVDSLDEYLEKIPKAGGEIVTPKIKVGEMGYYAYVKDTEGNVIGLWEQIS